MNFLAALLYLATGDEIIAFTLMTKVMFDLNWREVYKDQLIMLVELTKKVNLWLKRDHKAIATHLEESGVTLEA